jgi:hypothetical protein
MMQIEHYAVNSIKSLESALSPYYEETKALLIEIFKEFVK